MTVRGSRVSVAYGSGSPYSHGETWEPYEPTYTILDGIDGLSITGWQVKRGRQYFTDRTNAGTGQVNFADTAGVLDPTNSSGPFYPMDPNVPLMIELQNQFTGDFIEIYNGLIQDIPTTVWSGGAPVNIGQIGAADLFSQLANATLQPGFSYATQPTPGTYPYDFSSTTETNLVAAIYFAEQTVQDRLYALLTYAGIPVNYVNINSGNVAVQPTAYAAGYSLLAACQDAADAEWPGVANLFCTKQGIVAFLGRDARFDPSSYGANTWKVGDWQTVQGVSGEDYALLAVNGITLDRDVTKVINAAITTPNLVPSGDISISVDNTSTDNYGIRSYIAQNLLVAGGLADGLDATDEAFQYGQYYVDNFADAQTRIVQARFTQIDKGALNADVHWNMLCNVEIGDLMEVTTHHPGGGGFNADLYFVEGLTYNATPGGGPGGLPQLTLAVDLSPAAYFTTNPYEGGT